MKDDEFAQRIEAFDAAKGGGVGWYRDKSAYHLYLQTTEAPIAPRAGRRKRRSPPGILVTSTKWEDIDDMGGCVLPLDQALDHIANNGVFWIWTRPTIVQSRA